LTTKVTPVNPLLVVVSVDRHVLLKRTAEKFGDHAPAMAYEKRWEQPKDDFPVFKFRSSSTEEFEAYYARLTEVLQSETHPFKPEFHTALLSGNGIRRTFRSFLSKRSQR